MRHTWDDNVVQNYIPKFKKCFSILLNIYFRSFLCNENDLLFLVATLSLWSTFCMHSIHFSYYVVRSDFIRIYTSDWNSWMSIRTLRTYSIRFFFYSELLHSVKNIMLFSKFRRIIFQLFDKVVDSIHVKR